MTVTGTYRLLEAMGKKECKDTREEGSDQSRILLTIVAIETEEQVKGIEMGKSER